MVHDGSGSPRPPLPPGVWVRNGSEVGRVSVPRRLSGARTPQSGGPLSSSCWRWWSGASTPRRPCGPSRPLLGSCGQTDCQTRSSGHGEQCRPWHWRWHWRWESRRPCLRPESQETSWSSVEPRVPSRGLSRACLTTFLTSSCLAAFCGRLVRSTADTLAVGTREAVPVSFTFSQLRDDLGYSLAGAGKSRDDVLGRCSAVTPRLPRGAVTARAAATRPSVVLKSCRV